ncbi:MAG: pilin [Candidatus Buchananbacteria bacterium]
MNKKLLTILTATFLFCLLILPTLTWAADNTMQGLLDETAGAGGANYNISTSENSLSELVGNIARAVISLIGVIFISFTIYGGFLWMTAAGNDEKVTKAKNIIRDGAIGIVVILASAAIFYFVMSAISGTAGTQSSTSIQSNQ